MSDNSDFQQCVHHIDSFVACNLDYSQFDDAVLTERLYLSANTAVVLHCVR